MSEKKVNPEATSFIFDSPVTPKDKFIKEFLETMCETVAAFCKMNDDKFRNAEITDMVSSGLLNLSFVGLQSFINIINPAYINEVLDLYTAEIETRINKMRERAKQALN